MISVFFTWESAKQIPEHMFFQKPTISAFFTWELTKQIPIWNHPKDNIWNLK